MLNRPSPRIHRYASDNSPLLRFHQLAALRIVVVELGYLNLPNFCIAGDDDEGQSSRVSQILNSTRKTCQCSVCLQAVSAHEIWFPHITPYGKAF